MDEMLLLEKDKRLGIIPLELFPFRMNLYSACTVKSTHLKLFVEAIWYLADSIYKDLIEHVYENANCIYHMY